MFLLKSLLLDFNFLLVKNSLTGDFIKYFNVHPQYLPAEFDLSKEPNYCEVVGFFVLRSRYG